MKERLTATEKALDMLEAEVKVTVKVKLPEQHPEEIKPQEEMKRSAEMSDVTKLKAETSSELERTTLSQTRRQQQLNRKELRKRRHRLTKR